MRVKGTVEMSGETLLPPVWRSVGSGLTGKGELDVWVCEGSCLMARKSPWDGSRMGWGGERFYQKYLPSLPSG